MWRTIYHKWQSSYCVSDSTSTSGLCVVLWWLQLALSPVWKAGWWRNFFAFTIFWASQNCNNNCLTARHVHNVCFSPHSCSLYNYSGHWMNSVPHMLYIDTLTGISLRVLLYMLTVKVKVQVVSAPESVVQGHVQMHTLPWLYLVIIKMTKCSILGVLLMYNKLII